MLRGWTASRGSRLRQIGMRDLGVREACDLTRKTALVMSGRGRDFEMSIATPMKAIRAKCLDCAAGSSNEVQHILEAATDRDERGPGDDDDKLPDGEPDEPEPRRRQP